LASTPALEKTGFGVIRVERNQAQYVSSGTIRLPVKEALGARLRVLFESLSEIIDSYQPTVASIESVFMAKSADTLRSSWGMPRRGRSDWSHCVTYDLEVHEYAARQIKQSVVGTGAPASNSVLPDNVDRAVGVVRGAPLRMRQMALLQRLVHCHTQGLAGALAASRFRAGRLR
jgi:crossover junction endodeoxyribonuclease RuvC